MCKTLKSLLCAPAGTVSGQHSLEACTVDGWPGTVLKYMYIDTYTHTHTHTHVYIYIYMCACV